MSSRKSLAGVADDDVEVVTDCGRGNKDTRAVPAPFSLRVLANTPAAPDERFTVFALLKVVRKTNCQKDKGD